MDAKNTAIAEKCLEAAYDGSLSFPKIIEMLVDAGFEGYSADYRRNSQIYYLPDGDNIELALPCSGGPVAASFNASGIEALVRWAQSNEAGYSYALFTEKAKIEGCAGYHVSFPGRRVVYYGRTAETHLELFPQ
jgi:uncharacterized protein YbcV (DUF1398 family)